jgi:hypothetical protein
MYFQNEGGAKYSTNRLGTYNDIKYSQIFSVGEVVSVDDPNNMGRIKVRIYGAATRGGDDGIVGLIGSDGKVNSDVLPWALPMNSMVNTQPKVGEAVFVFSFDNTKPFIDRIYFGPIISQPQNLNKEPYNFSPLKGLSLSNAQPNVSVETIPELIGVFPNQQDISIQGRYNTDITQKRNEIVLRAGKFIETSPYEKNPYSFSFNKKTQGYIQIKNDVKITSANSSVIRNGTVTNIVSNKINLLSHDGSPKFNLTNQQNLISDSELEKILSTAHQVPFGDILLRYLRLMKNAILYHVHNGNGNPSTDLTASGNVQAIAAFKAKADELEKVMLSKNVRIN